ALYGPETIFEYFHSSPSITTYNHKNPPTNSEASVRAIDSTVGYGKSLTKIWKRFWIPPQNGLRNGHGYRQKDGQAGRPWRIWTLRSRRQSGPRDRYATRGRHRANSKYMSRMYEPSRFCKPLLRGSNPLPGSGIWRSARAKISRKVGQWRSGGPCSALPDC